MISGKGAISSRDYQRQEWKHSTQNVIEINLEKCEIQHPDEKDEYRKKGLSEN